MQDVLPKFNLDPSTATLATEEEVQKEIDSQSVGRFFDAGNYSLKIIEARFNKLCAAEDWMTMKITLGTNEPGDKREISLYQLMPITLNTKYQAPGKEKSTMFCWQQAKQFLTSVGESSRIEDLSKFLSSTISGDKCTKPIKYKKFSQETSKMEEFDGFSFHKLVGRVVEVDLGYEGHYIDRTENGYAVFLRNKVVAKEGNELVGDSFDECLLHCTEHDIEVTWLGVTKLYPAKRVTKINADLEAI